MDKQPAPLDELFGDRPQKKATGLSKKTPPEDGTAGRSCAPPLPASLAPSSAVLASDVSVDAFKRIVASEMFSPGSTFGVYQIGSCIGEGGMARIYQAEHAGLRRQVALKVLINGYSRDAEGRERFLREARIAAAIKHPNVVNIFDVGVHEDIPYLVMELLEGKDLEKLLEAQRPLDEGLIIDIMVPVLAGLTAAHDAGIVHRDLKPGNIFLARGRYNDLEPKVLDFGISTAPGPEQLKLTSNGTLMGTPFYMSPEGLCGGEMTPLSDQYSLGVVMYECATGRIPFSASTLTELYKLISTGQYTRPSLHNPALSKRLAATIERAMSLKPEDRFRDLREMGRELLLLAGQRTRITWGLSFGDVRPTLPSSLSPHASGGAGSSGSSTSPPAGHRWLKPGVLALCGIAALLALSAWHFAWRSSKGPSDSGASPAGETSKMLVGPPVPVSEPAPAPPAVATDKGSGSAIAAPSSSGGPAVDTTPPRAPASTEKSAARNRDVRPGRTTADQAAGRPSQRSGTAAAALRRPANAPSESEPDWVVPTTVSTPNQNKSGERRPEMGANGAPIFD